MEAIFPEGMEAHLRPVNVRCFNESAPVVAPRLKELRMAFQDSDIFEEREKTILQIAIKAGDMSKHAHLIAHHEKVKSGPIIVGIWRKAIGGSKEINIAGIQ